LLQDVWRQINQDVPLMNLSSTEIQASPGAERTATGSLAAGGFAAGLLASSCCILPLILVSLGVGGTWMSLLTGLSPYQPYFLGLAALSIGTGLWRAYRKPKQCAPGSLCAKPSAGRITKPVLWTGATLAVAAAGVDLLAPYLI
jgi:mercuric ion transport protein